MTQLTAGAFRKQKGTLSEKIIRNFGFGNFDGDNAIDLTGFTPTVTGIDGAIIKAGTSATPIVGGTTANRIFAQFYNKSTALSGSARGIYNRLYIAGAGGGGESLRSFTTVDNVAAETAHGAHISLNFNTTGSITGLGAAARCTLHVPNQAQVGGTYAAVQAEVFTDGDDSDIAGVTKASMFRVVNDGNATGIGKVDAAMNLFEISGFAIGDALMIRTNTATATHGIKIDIGGTRYDILVSDSHA